MTTATCELCSTPTERIIDCFAQQIYEVPDILHILGPNTGPAEELEAEADFGCFRILSQKDGDKRIIWCRRKIAEIAAAKKMFMDLLSKGMIPYKVGVDGKATANEMKEFDPTAEEIIFMPLRAISGG